MKWSNDTIGALGTAGTPLGNVVTVNSLSQGQIGPLFNGQVTGNGSTVLTINNNVPYFSQTFSCITFTGGLSGVATINYATPQLNILFPGITPRPASPRRRPGDSTSLLAPSLASRP